MLLRPEQVLLQNIHGPLWLSSTVSPKTPLGQNEPDAVRPEQSWTYGTPWMGLADESPESRLQPGLQQDHAGVLGDGRDLDCVCGGGWCRDCCRGGELAGTRGRRKSMSDDEPVTEYVPPDDEETGSPLVDAMNKFFRDVPTLHDPAEVQAFLKSVDGLPDEADRIEKFMQEIAARYEQWIRENRSDQS